ncbi:MAG: carbohydrate ABC transporter permease [Clostridiales bacterium]|jgi:putative aldouronate transport system permease protein|nr:carbohydrate ABC transporter permease [Clostridiales bacterium]
MQTTHKTQARGRGSYFQKSAGERIFDAVNVLFFTVLTFVMVFPFWNMLVISFVDYGDYVKNPFMVWPRNPTIQAYKFIFSSDELLNSMWVTVIVTVCGTALNMLVTLGAAYALSKKELPFRNFLLSMFLFTMFFSGGLVPYYVLVRQQLQMADTLWVMVLPVLVNIWNLIIIKNFFVNLPASLEESARIDGANDITILLWIVIPVSMPVIATFILFYGVERWNEWYQASLFIRDKALYPLQLLLREIVVRNVDISSMVEGYQATEGNRFVHNEAIKMASIVVATIPIVAVYPFLQKYFAKGVMIGAIKA